MRRPLNVVMATPLGHGGKGGIDRIVDALREESRAVPEVALRVLTTRGQGHIAAAPFHLGAAMAELLARRVLRRADVLHVHLSSHGSTWRKLVLCATARAVGLPYVVHLHGSRFREFMDGVNPWALRRIRAMFRGAAAILVLGEVWRTFLARHVPDAADRIRILFNASRAPLPPCPDALPCERVRKPATVLFLGRVGARKGVPVLLDALSRLPRRGWRAVIAGDGDVDATGLAVAERGMAARVSVPGWVGPDEVEQLLATADILVLPSTYENLPMSVVEAMAHGLTVVATPVGAVPDIIADNETGLLVPVNDPVRLAEALHQAVADPALRSRLGDAARAFHREHLEMSAYFRRLHGIWAEAAGKERTPWPA